MSLYVKKNGVATRVGVIPLGWNTTNTFSVPTTLWEQNQDAATSEDYPYVALIDTNIYSNSDTPQWQMNGMGDIPTATERESINMVLEAVFSSSGIILYAIDLPTENLTLEAGMFSKSYSKVGEHWTTPVSCSTGDTTCTIIDGEIATTSIIEDWCQNASGTKVVVPQITVTTGQAVLTFDALEEATSFRLHIYNL